MGKIERYAVTSFSQNPKQLERLDTHQTAKMLGLKFAEFLDMWKKGHITDKYVRRDPETKRWFVNRCDIPDLKQEIESHKAGDVKVIQEGPKVYTIQEIAEITGIPRATVWHKLAMQLRITPKRKVGNRSYYGENALNALKTKDHVTFEDIAEQLGVTLKTVKNMYARGAWPEEVQIIGKGPHKTYQFDKKAIELVRTYRTEHLVGRPRKETVKNVVEKPIEKSIEKPVEKPIEKEKPHDYFGLAFEVERAGFRDAAIWIIKNKC